MRSTAHLKGHPIHPMLIPFPLAFLTGAFAFDLAGRLAGHARWWTTGRHLAIAGIAAGLLAAVPGLIDYVRTVPPRSSGKQRATKHMLLNLSALLLFLIAMWVRRGGSEPATSVVVLEGLAVAAVFAGGWLGGVLVSRNQISVDHRYARAGKWNEESVTPSSGRPITVATAEELEVDQMKLIRVDGRRLVLGR